MRFVIGVAAFLLAAVPAAADERYHVVGSSLRVTRDASELDVPVSYAARFFIGDRRDGALFLCSGALTITRNENVLDARLGCSLLGTRGSGERAGPASHHALAIEGGADDRSGTDAFVTIFPVARTVRYCLVLSTLDLACAEAALPGAEP